MTHYDFAVTKDGKTMRFVGADDKGALFEKDGTQHNVTITEAPRGMGSPTVVNELGIEMPLKRVSKPCSCKGGIWKSRPSELLAKL